MRIPKKIESYLDKLPYVTDEVGMSSAKVLIYPDQVLKISPIDSDPGYEYQMLSWLAGKLPVPEVIAYEREEDFTYLLMSKMEGLMSFADTYMLRPKLQLTLLTDAIKALWRVDISDCPRKDMLEKRLEKAKERVEGGLVKIEYAEPDTFGPNGFQDPEELLTWLYENKPKKLEPVLSHGDFCLPNLIFKEDQLAGYIDLGTAGVEDKWCDIAICYRSLVYNYNRREHEVPYPPLDTNFFFEKLGVEPDWEKIRYYILLDELL